LGRRGLDICPHVLSLSPLAAHVGKHIPTPMTMRMVVEKNLFQKYFILEHRINWRIKVEIS
jgi:hypothetical protein